MQMGAGTRGMLSWCLAGVVCAGAGSASAQPPAGFNRAVVASGLGSPTGMDIAPDGRVFVALQSGVVRVIQNDVLAGTPFADLSGATDSSGERGMLGIAFDPGFVSNRFVYVYYTARTGGSHNRLSRLTASVSSPNQMQAGSEVVLLELPLLATLGDPIYHMGGGLEFMPDGSILVSVGDHLNSNLSQDLSSPMGKVLRLDRGGSALPSNPYYNASDGITFRDYVYCWGMRNPYSMAVQPGTGRVFVNDVGAETWEEIDEAIAGGNFGWPSTEGDFSQASFPGLRRPFYTYRHGPGCAITGGTFYNPPSAQFPPSYANRYFYSDLCSGAISTLDLGTREVSTFIPDASYPTTLAVSPNGALYYIARGDGASTGSVSKIDYSSASPPQITQQPASVTAAVGQPATFTVQAGGSGTLAYQWQRGGTDIGGATSASYTIDSVSSADNGASFRVRVTNALGSVLSNPAVLTVATSQPPVVTIVQPPEGATYHAGDTIQFQFSASDPDSGPIPAQNVTWWVVFHHDQHVHPFIAPSSGVLQGSFTIPVNGHTETDVWYRIHVTARDAGGLTSEATRDIVPITATLTIAASVDGAAFTLDGNPETTPITVEGVAGMVRRVAVPDIQAVDGQSYRFRSWSDGGAPAHELVFPSSDTTLTVTLEPAQETYLSDLGFANAPANGLGPVERDRSNGGISAGDGRVISIRGAPFAKGLGVAAGSEVAFNLDGRGTVFSATIGIDDETNGAGSVVFEVWGDGVRLYGSGVLDGRDAAVPISVPIDGIKQLRLVVRDAGDGNGSDHADWAGASIGMATGPSGPVAHYRMDEGNGTLVMDMTTFARHGTRSAGAAWGPGFIGLGALWFNGTSGDVTVQDAPQLNPDGPMSLTAWINTASWSGGDKRIVQKGSEYWLAESVGQLAWEIRGVGRVTGPLPGIGAWHHVAGTYNGGTMTLYMDGVYVRSVGAGGAVPASAAPLVIGWRPGGAAVERFNGAIDDVRVYDRALDSEEVRCLAGVVQINFQPAQGAPVSGYRVDSGDVYTQRAAGVVYGWNAPHTSACFERSRVADQRLDTLVLLHGPPNGSRWEIALANGVYEVSAAVGDASGRTTHTLRMEGAPAFERVVTNAGQFLERTRRVAVHDGRLTLDSADGSAYLDYLTIGLVERELCPGDFNRDGQVTVEDLSDFTVAFGASDPRADFDSDGVVEPQDFFAFVEKFLRGCQ